MFKMCASDDRRVRAGGPAVAEAALCAPTPVAVKVVNHGRCALCQFLEEEDGVFVSGSRRIDTRRTCTLRGVNHNAV